MSALSARVLYYKYPQYRWATAIDRALTETGVPDGATLIDAPCGDGIVSYWLVRRRPEPFELLDLSGSAVESARKRVGGKSTTFKQGDIFDLGDESGDDVWLLVNSLYLLPEPERLVTALRPRMAIVVGIFPYLGDENFLAFTRKYPDFPNINLMEKAETLELFARAGYRTVLERDVTAFRYHKLPARHLIRPMSLVYNVFDPGFADDGAYWLGVFARTEEEEG